jgi:hypothetical protein
MGSPRDSIHWAADFGAGLCREGKIEGEKVKGAQPIKSQKKNIK